MCLSDDDEQMVGKEIKRTNLPNCSPEQILVSFFGPLVFVRCLKGDLILAESGSCVILSNPFWPSDESLHVLFGFRHNIKGINHITIRLRPEPRLKSLVLPLAVITCFRNVRIDFFHRTHTGEASELTVTRRTWCNSVPHLAVYRCHLAMQNRFLCETFGGRKKPSRWCKSQRQMHAKCVAGKELNELSLIGTWEKVFRLIGELFFMFSSHRHRSGTKRSDKKVSSNTSAQLWRANYATLFVIIILMQFIIH